MWERIHSIFHSTNKHIRPLFQSENLLEEEVSLKQEFLTFNDEDATQKNFNSSFRKVNLQSFGGIFKKWKHKHQKWQFTLSYIPAYLIFAVIIKEGGVFQKSKKGGEAKIW